MVRGRGTQRQGEWTGTRTADLGPSGLEGDTGKRNLGTHVVQEGRGALSSSPAI